MKIFAIGKLGKARWAAFCVALTSVFVFASVSNAQAEKPYGLECESLVTPMGMDAKRDVSERIAERLNMHTRITVMDFPHLGVWRYDDDDTNP